MEYFSNSQLQTYLRCPREYYNVYILKRQSPSNLAMTFGKAIHKSLEIFYKTGDQKLAEDDFIDNFIKTSQDIQLKPGENLGREGMLGVKMLHEYFKPENRPFIQPKEIEYEFKVLLKHPLTKKELPVPIKGIMDIITTDNFILDHKTAGNIWTEERIDSDMQKVIYWMAFMTLFGKEPSGFIFNFLIKRVKQPKFDFQATDVSTGQMIGVLNLIQKSISEIEHFNKIGWENMKKKCSSRWCKYCNE